ncbi:hypothetical protein Tco_0602366 [Tanacetum coccineum]
METNQGTSVPSEPRADTSFVHWKFEPLIDLTYESYKTSKSCGANKFFGTERAVGLLSWLEGMEYVLYISKCPAIAKSRLNLMEHTSLDKRSGNCYSPTLGGPKEVVKGGILSG